MSDKDSINVAINIAFDAICDDKAPAVAPTEKRHAPSPLQSDVRRHLLTSLSQEEFDAIEGPTVEEMRDAMERGRRAAAAAFPNGNAARCPRRTLPEDGDRLLRTSSPAVAPVSADAAPSPALAAYLALEGGVRDRTDAEGAALDVLWRLLTSEEIATLNARDFAARGYVRERRVDSIGTCKLCGYHGPGPSHECNS